MSELPPILINQPQKILHSLFPQYLTLVLPQELISSLSKSYSEYLSNLPHKKLSSLSTFIQDLKLNKKQYQKYCLLITNEILPQLFKIDNIRKIKESKAYIQVFVSVDQNSSGIQGANNQCQNMNLQYYENIDEMFFNAIKSMQKYDLPQQYIKCSLEKLIDKQEYAFKLLLTHNNHPQHYLWDIASSETSLLEHNTEQQKLLALKHFNNLLKMLPPELSELDEIEQFEEMELDEKFLRLCNLMINAKNGNQIWVLNYIRGILNKMKFLSCDNNNEHILHNQNTNTQSSQLQLEAQIPFPKIIQQKIKQKYLSSLKKTQNSQIFINSFIYAKKHPNHGTINNKITLKIIYKKSDTYNSSGLPINRLYINGQSFVFGPMNLFVVRSMENGEEIVLQWVPYRVEPINQLQYTSGEHILKLKKQCHKKQLNKLQNQLFFNNDGSSNSQLINEKIQTIRKYQQKQYELLRMKQNYFMTNYQVDADQLHDGILVKQSLIKKHMHHNLFFRQFMRICQKLANIFLQIFLNPALIRPHQQISLSKLKKYYQIAITIATIKNQLRNFKKQTCINIIILYTLYGDYSRALKYMKQFEYNFVGAPQLLRKCRLTKAKIYHDNGKYKQALRMIKQLQEADFTRLKGVQKQDPEYYNKLKDYYDILATKNSFIEDMLVLYEISSQIQKQSLDKLTEQQLQTLQKLYTILSNPTQTNPPTTNTNNNIFFIALKILILTPQSTDHKQLLKLCIQNEKKKQANKRDICILWQFWRFFANQEKQFLSLIKCTKQTMKSNILNELLEANYLIKIAQLRFNNNKLKIALKYYKLAAQIINKLLILLKQRHGCILPADRLNEIKVGFLFREQISDKYFCCIEEIPSANSLFNKIRTIQSSLNIQ